MTSPVPLGTSLPFWGPRLSSVTGVGTSAHLQGTALTSGRLDPPSPRPLTPGILLVSKTSSWGHFRLGLWFRDEWVQLYGDRAWSMRPSHPQSGEMWLRLADGAGRWKQGGILPLALGWCIREQGGL